MANKTLNTRIVIRNDTLANWTTNKSKVLLKGEIGLETDTGKYKIGNGSTTWENLTYYSHLTSSKASSLDTLITMLDNDQFGKVDDVQIDSTSILDSSTKIAGFSTINGDYDSSTNKIATEADLPTQASDVGALPDSTKYGATLSVSGTTVTLKDQDGNTLSTITTQDTDTGATALSGNTSETGKAFVSASYNDSNRTITFTKGTFLTEHQDISGKLDKKPDGTNDLIVNNKVSTTYLPDQILGQLLYGGNVTGAGVATLTPNAKTKLGTSSDTITLTNDTTAITGYGANDGLYYIASSDGNFASLGLFVGDWLISVGTAWKKIDNTDAVTGVKGNAENSYRIGNIEIDPDNLDDTSSTNKFVTASDKTTWNGKQDAIDSSHKLSADLVDDTNATNKFVTATEKSTWSGKQDAIDSSHKLSADLVDDTNTTNKFVTSSDKTTWNAKYDKPSGGIPSTDLAESYYLASNPNGYTKVESSSTNGNIKINNTETTVYSLPSSVLQDTDTFILDGGSSTTGS